MIIGGTWQGDYVVAPRIDRGESMVIFTTDRIKGETMMYMRNIII